MGAYSNLNLEQQQGMADAVQQTQSTAPAASPFVSGAFSAPIPRPAIVQTPAPTVPSQTANAAVQPAPQQVTQTAAPSVSAPAAPKPAGPAAAPTAAKPQNVQNSAESKPGDGKKPDEDEAAKRKAHEEAEAKRKAEWEAKFAERRAKEKAERERVAALSDDAVMQEAMDRVSKGFEQLTRRNMKDMVSEYVQAMCVSDPVFGRSVMNPVKSMINCVKYINNKAREFIQKDMENNDMKPENGMYGGDVPDDVVYQWAVDYFNDPNAKEDERPEEEFTPKPYIGGHTVSAKSKKDKAKEKEAEKAKKEAEKKAAAQKAAEEKAKAKADDGQMSLLGAA